MCWDDFNSTMIYDPLIKDVTCLTFPQMHFVKRVYIRFQVKHAKSNTIRMGSVRFAMYTITDYGQPERKSPALHGQKSNPNPKFISAAKAYFV